MAERTLTVHPVTAERWPDLERLFGPKGAYGGCWCMLNRLSRREVEAGKGEGNRRAMKALVENGQVPGLLAYDEDEPVGWCSVAPREAFPGLARSRIMKPLDARPVWSVTCFFIRKTHRNRGLSVALLNAVCDYVRDRGGELVEGYPVEPKQARMADVFAWTGLAASFRAAGFTEVLRRSETRPIMRREVGSG